ncbi:RISC-loading complex subunit tarbp2 isoform X2 [Amyelois transitella]|uniref:RISC-loading complex subunit tarbp2 isoform X2 n=1 Tax=Amyelois transitella TaxID=680683 RepID=UPI00298F9C11|nr:RISC-loading complex subunit tarbp2 isoform X2 [Amyelois transitella]
MTDMKTAATVLQEMMVKLHTMPHYECISQSGPQHQAMFEYRCKAQGIEVTATGRCKKDAKQEVAKLMLRELAAAGYNVPMPYRLDNYQAAQIGKNIPGAGDNVEPASMGSRSYVALLKELCAEYRLPSVEYDLTSDTGPAHQRHFTMVARVGQHSRCATSTTKKAARQLAAEKLYSYLRENLSITKDFDEEDALARAHERVMERYQEAAEDAARRPDLGPEALSSGRAALAARAGAEPQSALAAAAAALGLAVQYAELPAQRGPPVAVVALEPAAPAVLLAGADRDAAARAALRYLQHAL